MKTIMIECKHCGIDILSPDHKLERRWYPMKFGGFIGDACVKAPRMFNIANPSGRL